MIARAVEALRGRSVAVLTGAGLSTDSGIPDYRGPGAPVRRPMTLQQFLDSEDARRRYWVGSHLGWRAFGAVEPNGGHHALTRLERAGIVTGVVTQNVDGLHSRAGTRRVVELHGAMRQAVCLSCGQVYARHALADRIEADNPWLASADRSQLGPDGDVLPESTAGFVVPRCRLCGGVLKPDVVFFGEYVPPATFRLAEQVLRTADALLVAGSSLAVNSGVRLLDRARRRGLPIVVVNRGPTRADAHAEVKIDDGATATLDALADALVRPPSPAA